MSDRAGATTTLPHLISAAISVAYEKHQTASETKLVKATTRLSCAARTVYQLGSAQRKQLLRAQNRFTQEAVLIL